MISYDRNKKQKKKIRYTAGSDAKVEEEEKKNEKKVSKGFLPPFKRIAPQ